MAVFYLPKLSILLTLVSNANFGLWRVPSNLNTNNNNNIAVFPPTCNRIECPSYDVVDAGNGYEIRRYNSTVWMSTYPIEDISLVQATRTGFLLLFDYIQGKNNYSEKIEMTAPVVTKVLASEGPFCKSVFTVRFYVPKINQGDPPPAKGLQVQRFKPLYMAVRQFSGFVTDYNVAEEAAALKASLAGTKWNTNAASVYEVAQYNSPFEFDNRVNEIWIVLLV